MEYAEYRPDSKNVVLKNRSAYRLVGHTCATYAQYVVYVAEGVAKDDVTITFEVDVRYAGQAFEVPMSVTRDDLHTHGIEWLTGRFDEEHHRLFTFNMDKWCIRQNLERVLPRIHVSKWGTVCKH